MNRQRFEWNEMTVGVCYYPEHWEESLWESDLDRMLANGITVIRQPAYEMGEQAATSILAQLDQNAPSPVTHIMDVELIRRGSIKNLNNA